MFSTRVRWKMWSNYSLLSFRQVSQHGPGQQCALKVSHLLVMNYSHFSNFFNVHQNYWIFLQLSHLFSLDLSSIRTSRDPSEYGLKPWGEGSGSLNVKTGAMLHHSSVAEVLYNTSLLNQHSRQTREKKTNIPKAWAESQEAPELRNTNGCSAACCEDLIKATWTPAGDQSEVQPWTPLMQKPSDTDFRNVWHAAADLWLSCSHSVFITEETHQLACKHI